MASGLLGYLLNSGFLSYKERENAADTTLHRYLGPDIRAALVIESGNGERGPSIRIGPEDFDRRVKRMVRDLLGKNGAGRKLSSRSDRGERERCARGIRDEFGLPALREVSWRFGVDDGQPPGPEPRPKIPPNITGVLLTYQASQTTA